MSSLLLERSVMEGFDGRVLDRPDHPFGLAVGHGVIGLGQATSPFAASIVNCSERRRAA